MLTCTHHFVYFLLQPDLLFLHKSHQTLHFLVLFFQAQQLLPQMFFFHVCFRMFLESTNTNHNTSE